MIKQRKIELLAPAKNLECGMAAVDHGADAVYIGAPRFGARAAAGNSLEDIAALVQYAHLYNVRIYVTRWKKPERRAPRFSVNIPRWSLRAVPDGGGPPSAS